MKLSTRLMTCAELVQKGNIAADIGTDHGYLPIYLLKSGTCPKVIAADLREKPLAAAKRSAAQAGIRENIEFYLSDGLRNVPLTEARTIICAGMGGDCIIGILDGAKQVWNPSFQLVLQPQSAVAELRNWLGENGFSILQERFAVDGKFVYTIMEVRFGGGMELNGAQCYLPQGEFDRKDPLYLAYLDRVAQNLAQTVRGLERAKQQQPERLAEYRAALEAVTEGLHENGT